VAREQLLALGFTKSAVEHRIRPSLPASAITTRLSIPLTQPVQTFLDLVTVTGPKALERAINEADKRDVIDPTPCARRSTPTRASPGVRPLRRVLDKHTFRLSDDP
jgi:hypothetical protein